MDKFYNLLYKQLDNLFFLYTEEKALTETLKNDINNRFLANCKHLKNKYYSDVNNLTPYHSCQYTMFLYFAANTIFKQNGRLELCDKMYNLSKIVSAADIYYEIELPEIFMFDHPVGTVLGRAKYGNYFTFSQGCTVGNNKGIYPVIGNCVSMMSNSKILGNCKIGDNVIISANTYIKDKDVPSNCIVFNGASGDLIFKETDENLIKQRFDSVFSLKEDN